MRIAHIMKWYMPGLGYQENYLPFYQAELGCDVYIIASNWNSPQYWKLKGRFVKEDEEANQNVRICRLPVGFFMRTGHMVFLKGLRKTIDRIQPDVVFLHGIFEPFTMSSAFRNRCFPGKDIAARFYIDNHIDNDNFHLDSFFKKTGFIIYKKFLLPSVLDLAETVFAVNPESYEILRKKFEIREDKLAILPLGVDDRLASSMKLAEYKSIRTAMRKNLNLHKDEVVFLFTGNITPTKELETILRAFQALNKELSGFRAILIGKGNRNYVSELKALSNSLGIDDLVLWKEWVPHSDLHRYYICADVGLMPGKLGGIKDILAWGKPLIVCDDAALKYFVKNHNGLIFQKKNFLHLAKNMKRYIFQNDLAKNHGEKSLELVQNELSWKVIARKSLEFLGKNA